METRSYIASLTREPFMFQEMRVVAKLMNEGIEEDEIVQKVHDENLFQYPTERSLKQLSRGCVKRLKAMDNPGLVSLVATANSDTAKQICLYALMKQSRLFWEFMLTVVGEKYRIKDFSFGRIDLNLFFIRLQEQNDEVAGWSDSTIAKLKQIFTKILVDTGYLDNVKSTRLNPVWLQPELELAIREKGDTVLMPVFNRFD